MVFYNLVSAAEILRFKGIPLLLAVAGSVVKNNIFRFVSGGYLIQNLSVS